MSADKILQVKKEIKIEAGKSALFHSFLESIVLFTVLFVLIESILRFIVPFVFFIVNFYITYKRRNLIVFEEINSNVEYSLRTAIEAAEEGQDNTMSEILYRSVLRDLQEASSEGFISEKRLLYVLGLFVPLVVIGLGVQFSPVDFGEITGGGSTPGEGEGESEASAGGSLNDSLDKSDILGEEQDVIRGNESVSLGLRYTGGGGDDGEFESQASRNYEPEVDPSGVEQSYIEEDIRNADLIIEYQRNLDSE